VIFKAVRDGRPYPDHGLSSRDWANVAPRTVRLAELTTTKRQLELDHLLAALQGRTTLHVRILDLDAFRPADT
jgi:hypothetical protein